MVSKLSIYPTSSTSELYEFKMSLFENVEPEEFLLVVRKFNMTFGASGMLEAGAKIQYLGTLFRGESLRQFDSLSANVQIMQTLNVDDIIKGLAQYFSPVNSLSKQKRAMRRGMKKSCALTVRRYVARLIDIDEYLASFPGATLNDTICVTELNEILLNNMPDSWYRQAYVKCSYCGSITFKTYVNVFERMEIVEYIYEGVVEPFYKKPTR